MYVNTAGSPKKSGSFSGWKEKSGGEERRRGDEKERGEREEKEEKRGEEEEQGATNVGGEKRRRRVFIHTQLFHPLSDSRLWWCWGGRGWGVTAPVKQNNDYYNNNNNDLHLYCTFLNIKKQIGIITTIAQQ